MNYGQHGRNLLLELKRSEPSSHLDSNTASTIPPYNDLLVGNALQDLQLHCKALEDQVKASGSAEHGGRPSIHVRPSLLLQNAAIQRNKRCLLTYHVVRLRRIQQELYWKQQTNGSSTSTTNLCPAEQDFLDKYQTLLQGYTQAVCADTVTDLRAHTSMPPQPSDRVIVRVLEELGPMVLESGASAVMSQGSTHCLLYADVEEYIRQGTVVVLHGEEEE